MRLVRVYHCHAGELANDDDAGARQVGSEPGDQRTDAGAANLLVIGDDDVDRLLSSRDVKSGTEASTEARKPFMSQEPRL